MSPSAQPVSDGELKQYLKDNECTGRYCNHETTDTHYIVGDEIIKMFKDAHNSGHAAQFAKDQAELVPEAYQDGYQSGYAAAVGDAVAVAPKRQPILGINLDEPSKSIERARREGSNKGIDHYRTAIEALAPPKHTNVTEE